MCRGLGWWVIKGHWPDLYRSLRYQCTTYNIIWATVCSQTSLMVLLVGNMHRGRC